MDTKQDSVWNIESYRLYNEAMRAAEEKLREAMRESDRLQEALRAAEEKFQAERDRRYAEVATEREKALKIKETADLAALGLAREIQTYKDEKANELREQISKERGDYPTRTELKSAIEKIEATIKPISEYVVTQQGGPRAITTAMLVTIITVGLALMGGLITVILMFKK